MIVLISTPEYITNVSPEIISRWVATESPNNFRLHRRDFDIVTAVSYGATLLRLTVAAGTYGGSVGSVISVYNKTLDAMFLGEVLAGSGTTTIDTNIKFITGFAPGDPALDPDRLITYINDYTLYGGYYFEGRLTINDIAEILTVIASPDTFGYADLDVSGLLRIHTALGKIGDYTAQIMKETIKSGKFSFEYRYKTWSDLTQPYIPEGGCISPPSDEILWYYGECVRSEEQGSNLHEYVPTTLADAPFLNLFNEPVYFDGLPFDITYILPETVIVSPSTELIVTLKVYNIANTQLGADIITYVAADELEGYFNSLAITPESLPVGRHHMTAEIEIPE